jgi:hypothetical protein
MSEQHTDPKQRFDHVLPTKYGGRLYRSRTEARWAVFFNALGVQFQYEPEGYQLGGIRYLPDFFIPDWSLFVEVKPPQGPTAIDQAKVEALVAATALPAFIALGDPGMRRGIFIDPRNPDHGGMGRPDNAFPAFCRRCPQVVMAYEWPRCHGGGYIELGECQNKASCGNRFPSLGGGMTDAISRACTERFGQ